ncbi:NAD/FAD-dependent oxidoreductase [Halorientalis sp. IM1011]|uniref:NAD(P)/FAD-dependent oxidoreductase n=1 Tax=Halorientalis sp. IM1011 TaxID=1932360 RepID=UPI00097CCF96|nr:FAD-dependent oxidoreductase [Halorientalis sp. IM1011]AQL44169.1 NAD/FAD-dependent oxidoreductase [Halorientalis sp. IM1011]
MADDIAIVGAGAAGAGAAYALADADASVTVFEKSGGVCGRAATRRREGCRYDHGANYVKADDERVTELVTDGLDTEGLVDIAEPVWVFDADGEISEGRDADDHKWTYETGITQLAKRLFGATDASVENGVRISEPVRENDGWRLYDTDHEDLGHFDAVLLTPPAPQTADLLGSANWEHRLCRELREAVAVIPYRTIVSAVLHYPFELDQPYYALVNTDDDHDVGWVSREECKDGHVPDGESLLIAQMSPDWSVDHYDDADGAITATAAERVAELLDDERLADPDWTDTQHWRYALADDGVDAGTVDRAAEHGLYLAGDWVAGEARVHAALRNGLETGERITDRR